MYQQHQREPESRKNMAENDSVEPSVDQPAESENKLSTKPTVGMPNIGRGSNTEPKSTKEKSPTKFGKANPVRDVLLLLAFLGVLMLLSSENGDRKKKTEEDDEPEKLSLSSIETILKNAAKQVAGSLRKDQCSIFLHTGTIPNTGLGYFAGRNYTVGEIMLEDDRTFPVPVTKSDNSIEYIYATPSALVLKHHPILYNMEGVLHYKNENNVEPKPQLRASKSIQEGDELFVEYDPTIHDNPIFNHIPTNSHYSRAKEIVTDALRSVPDQAHRSGRVTCRMAPVMRFVRQTVARYDPMVATLLPESHKRATYYRKLHPSVATLRNSSLLQLRHVGVCMDDIVPPTNGDDDAAFQDPNVVVAVAQRKFRRGNVVITVPLYIMKTSTISVPSSQTCSLEQDCSPVVPQRYCFVNDNMTTISFCPLGPAIIIQQKRDEAIDPTEVDSQLVNVEYRWSRHNGVTEHFAMRDEFKFSTSITGWDVVALRDIAVGEKLVVNGMPPDVPDHIQALHGNII